MKLLIVTDHRFFEYGGEFYDNYVFGYDFFLDYLNVFDEVIVMARVKNLSVLPNNYIKASGIDLSFLPVRDYHGFKWLLGMSILPFKDIWKLDIDAICFRIPSILSYRIYRKLNRNRKLKPYMFEFIGDPKDALINQNDSFVKKFIFARIGDLMNMRMRTIVGKASCGSYVSFKHLQEKFPANSVALTTTISSIRLESKYIKYQLENIDLGEINIVHVGSFVPIKNHELLVRFIRKLKDNGIHANLTLLGDGPLLELIKRKTIDLGIDKQVRFEGHIVGFENIVKKLDAHNVFILPSFSEGMPRALIEAMARGLVCFGSKRGGIQELLENEFIFNPADINELLLKFVKIINDPVKIEESRYNNLQKVKYFEKEVLSAKRKTLLNHLISI